jgi:alanyl-tRNA synthetase
MTKKLYLDDPYLLSCSSEVSGQTQVDGKPGIILDQTVFYPTSGGQPHDTGTINNVAVVDVLEDENKQIVHLLEKPISALEIEATINWERRFDHMQQHTGQHVLSQAFVKAWDADTLSFHLGEKSASIDLIPPGLTAETITTVEQLANRIIFENRAVIGRMVGQNELKQFPVRGVPSVEENIRILEIKDYDYSPCGGTHCAKTGEIGIVKIRRHENYKGGTRVHFVCGFRALKDYQEKAEILKNLSGAMSAAEVDLPQNITKMKNDLKALMGERDHLNKILLNYEADALFSESKSQKQIHLIKSVFEDRNQKEVKLLAKKILEKYPDIVILFGIKAAGKAQLLFHRSEELAFNMGELMETACAVINGRGGGRPQQAQGGGSDVGKLEEALQGAEDMLFKMIDSV